MPCSGSLVPAGSGRTAEMTASRIHTRKGRVIMEGLFQPIHLLIILVLVGLPLYFLPSILGRNKRNAGTIFLINLLAGWIGVGWIIALILALRTEQPGIPQASRG